MDPVVSYLSPSPSVITLQTFVSIYHTMLVCSVPKMGGGALTHHPLKLWGQQV